ncbi:MAG: GHKL domain-containing protein [Candidatus Lokiarchaeota archaeon]|nr:GHKL domain-containing protein [Candidatus Lokiarchaeota archaeon]
MKEDSESEILPSIHSASELAARIADILNRVKELAELRDEQEKQFKPINLKNARERSVSLVEDMLADAEFVVDYTQVDYITIRADELVEQVFVSLIENSVEHCSSTKPIVEIASKEANSIVLLYFRDNCPRLPKKVKLTLFDEFAPSKKGLGLGLFVVKKLMIRYKGDLNYSELENRQKEFVLTF